MWLEDLAEELKVLNQKIDKVHKQAEQKIEQLKALYGERERLIDQLLEDEEDE